MATGRATLSRVEKKRRGKTHEETKKVKRRVKFCPKVSAHFVFLIIGEMDWCRVYTNLGVLPGRANREVFVEKFFW